MLLQKLERAFTTRALIPHGASLVVAVSGGPDSLALLHALRQLQARYAFALHVASFDHRLRGDDGASDVAFVRDTSLEWGIPVTTGSADVGALAAEWRLSIEAAARQARYRFLAEVARAAGAVFVATAHNADDQAETVLMHVLRGAGLTGLSGMRVSSPLPDAPDLTLIRPLLDVTRDEVLEYCTEHRLAPRADATNAIPLYLRNRLRLEVMPLLRQINPQVSRQLRQLAEAAATDASYIDEAFARQLADRAMIEGGAVTLPLAVFQAAHPALQRRFIVWAARQLLPLLEVSYVQQLAAVAIVVSGQVGAEATLPSGLRLRVDYERVVVERVDRPEALIGWLLEPGMQLDVRVPGITETAEWTLVASTTPPETFGAALDIPEGASVRLRTRRPGDRFAPLGMSGHTQKLKSWLIDHKIPQRQRDRLPLLEVDGEIAALVTGERWPVSERFALRSDTARAIWFAAEL